MEDEFIQKLVNKIKEVSEAGLKLSEADTKGCFIEPFLRYLGFPIEDPVFFKRELVLGGGLVDYALLNNEQEVKGIIEAKPLRTDLENEDFDAKIKKYADGANLSCGILTNGRFWHFCEIRKEDRIVRFSIEQYELTNESSPKILCMKLKELLEETHHQAERFEEIPHKEECLEKIHTTDEGPKIKLYKEAVPRIVLEYIKKCDVVKLSEVIQALKNKHLGSVNTIRGAVIGLYHRGFIQKVGPGRYKAK